jgi:hypothetical protein
MSYWEEGVKGLHEVHQPVQVRHVERESLNYRMGAGKDDESNSRHLCSAVLFVFLGSLAMGGERRMGA